MSFYPAMTIPKLCCVKEKSNGGVVKFNKSQWHQHHSGRVTGRVLHNEHKSTAHAIQVKIQIKCTGTNTIDKFVPSSRSIISKKIPNLKYKFITKKLTPENYHALQSRLSFAHALLSPSNLKRKMGGKYYPLKQKTNDFFFCKEGIYQL